MAAISSAVGESAESSANPTACASNGPAYRRGKRGGDLTQSSWAAVKADLRPAAVRAACR